MKHVHAEVIKAWADDCSLVVQYRSNERDEWSETDDGGKLAWLADCQYRIKPQPKAISWSNVYRDGRTGFQFETKEMALTQAIGKPIFVLEVRDDGTAHLHKVEA